MPRTSRLLMDDRPTVYHVISRTYLPGFPLGDLEKEHLLRVIKRFSSVYFAEVLGFCIMGNHFHLLVRMRAGGEVTDSMIMERYQAVFGAEAPAHPKRLNAFRRKWCSLSAFIQEIKQTFSRYYNKMHGRRGFFWGERFKSVIVQDGRTLVNCLAYIDLNPVRARIAKRPEDYRWCSLGYHMQSGNEDGFLSLDLGMADWDIEPGPERVRLYREFVYRTGALETGKGAMEERILARAAARCFEYSRADRFAMRSRWFTEGAILGTREFVADAGRALGMSTADKRRPKRVDGLEGCYSFRRLREVL